MNGGTRNAHRILDKNSHLEDQGHEVITLRRIIKSSVVRMGSRHKWLRITSNSSFGITNAKHMGSVTI